MWLVFNCVAILKHPRFGPWWGLPSTIVGAVLFAVNAITVPDPPAAVRLFDPGPLVGPYAGAVSAYLTKLGLSPRSENCGSKDHSRHSPKEHSSPTEPKTSGDPRTAQVGDRARPHGEGKAAETCPPRHRWVPRYGRF